jgi:peroxiredoxin (alkyl hydroperoxide reductase subunit C)
MQSRITLVCFILLAVNSVYGREPLNQSLEPYSPPIINCQPRQKAPFFTATAVFPNGKFDKVSLSDFEGKYLVVIFYPFDFTYVCPTELIAFSEQVQTFKSLSAEIIGISTDSHFTHLAWTKTPRNQGGVGQLEFPLLADISKQISKKYGVLVED